MIYNCVHVIVLIVTMILARKSLSVLGAKLEAMYVFESLVVSSSHVDIDLSIVRPHEFNYMQGVLYASMFMRYSRRHPRVQHSFSHSIQIIQIRS